MAMIINFLNKERGRTMKLKKIYKLFVEKGMQYDPRGLETMQKLLSKEQKKYADLKESEKQFYDLDCLTNPYRDSRILYGDLEEEIGHILVGVDMEASEIILADRLIEKGRNIDLVMAHHPEGRAYAGLYDVMHLQEDVLEKFGVPINVAESILAPRIEEVRRNILPANHNRAVDAARLLDLPFMCAHTVADNLVNYYLQNKFDQLNPETVEDVLESLKEEYEYAKACEMGAGPTIVVGNKNRRAGKVMLDMTGGTSGSKDAFEKLSQTGIGTLVVMHVGEVHREEALKHHINVIIAGHMASDSIGLNLLLSYLEPYGIEIIPCSGFIRYSRTLG